MKQILLILSLAFILTAQIISIEQTNASSPINHLYTSKTQPFQDFPLNASEAVDKEQIDLLLQMVKNSEAVIGDYGWSWGFLRKYPENDWYLDFHLYLRVRDSRNNSREVEFVIGADHSKTIYCLLSINENVQKSQILDSSATFQPIIRPIFNPKTHDPFTNQSQIYQAFSRGFDKMTQEQIGQDPDLSGLSTDIANLYQTNFGISAVFRKNLSQSSTGYIIFYGAIGRSGLWSAFGVVDRLRKVHYIMEVSEIDTSALGK